MGPSREVGRKGGSGKPQLGINFWKRAVEQRAGRVRTGRLQALFKEWKR